MNTTHDDHATTWRDLTDQLTAEQVESFSDAERESDDPRTAHLLLEFARKSARNNLTQAAYSDIPTPAGATVDGWSKNLQRDGWSRSVEWLRIGDDVYIDGRQQCDGTYTCEVAIYADEDRTGLSAVEARALAAALLEAANALDAL